MIKEIVEAHRISAISLFWRKLCFLGCSRNNASNRISFCYLVTH